jgi:putative hydrolase of HD superfamily
MIFLQEIDTLKQIVRRTYLLDGSRRENYAEHSWASLGDGAPDLWEHAQELIRQSVGQGICAIA